MTQIHRKTQTHGDTSKYTDMLTDAHSQTDRHPADIHSHRYRLRDRQIDTHTHTGSKYTQTVSLRNRNFCTGSKDSHTDLYPQ